MANEIVRTCPKCGPATRLEARTNRATGKPFLGCPNWYREEDIPGCTYTEPIPLDMELRRQGHTELPGF